MNPFSALNNRDLKNPSGVDMLLNNQHNVQL